MIQTENRRIACFLNFKNKSDDWDKVNSNIHKKITKNNGDAVDKWLCFS